MTSEARTRRDFLRAAASGAALATLGPTLAACGGNGGESAAEGGRNVIRSRSPRTPCGTT